MSLKFEIVYMFILLACFWVCCLLETDFKVNFSSCCSPF